MLEALIDLRRGPGWPNAIGGSDTSLKKSGDFINVIKAGGNLGWGTYEKSHFLIIEYKDDTVEATMDNDKRLDSSESSAALSGSSRRCTRVRRDRSEGRRRRRRGRTR